MPDFVDNLPLTSGLTQPINGGQIGYTLDWASSALSIPPLHTLTRSGINATYYNSSGVMATAGADVARFSYNPATLALEGLMVEAAATNSCLQARALGTAPWSVSGTAASQNVTGRDGVANKAWTLTDASAASFDGSYSQNITVPVDSLPTAIAVWLKKTSGGTSPTFGINITISGGTLVAASPRFNADNGAILSGAGNAVVTDEGNWWRIDTYITNNGTALNTTFNVSLFPATAANGSGVDTVTATGSNVIDGVVVQIGANRVGSFIDTTAAAATRNADVLNATTSGLLSSTQGFAAISFKPITAPTTGNIIEATNLPMSLNAGQLSLNDGTAARDFAALSLTVGTTVSLATTWGGVACNGAVSGTVGTSRTFDGDMGLGSTITVMGGVSGYLKSMRYSLNTAAPVNLANPF